MYLKFCSTKTDSGRRIGKDSVIFLKKV